MFIQTRNPDPLTAARHALAGVQHGFDEDYLRTWFRESLGGSVAPAGSGLRLEACGIACPTRRPWAEALADWAEFVLATREPDPLAAFLHLIAPRDPYIRAALVEAAVVATGGTWVPAQRPAFPGAPAEWGGSHLYEIGLFGVLGRGADPIDATRDWIKAASRIIQREAA